jgi:flagellar hook-basal body complex protein FliE
MTAPAFISPVTTMAQAIANAASTSGVGTPLLSGAEQASGFAASMQAQIHELDRKLKTAQVQSLRLAAGQADSLHQVTLSLEQARIEFQFALQLRNRLVEAWQELWRMQL